MKYKVINRDVGLLMCDQRKKLFWWIPLAASAAMTGLEYLTGNDSASMQNKQNDINKEIAHEANVYNRQIATETNKMNWDIAKAYNKNQIQLQKEAQAYNEEMWNKANAYNSPKENIKRYLEAGVNPNFSMGQISNVQPLTTEVPDQMVATASSPASAVTPDIKAVNKTAAIKPLIESIVNAPQIKEQLKNLSLTNKEKEEDVRRKKIDNDIKERSNKAYDSMSFIVNPHDDSDVITPSMYDELSDDEQKRYREVSTTPDGKTIRVNGKEVYSTLPNIQKMSFGSREVYDDFMHRIRTASEIRSMNKQSIKDILDSKVFYEQVNNPKVIKALANMPKEQLNTILNAARKANQDYKESVATFQTRKEMLEKQLESFTYDLKSKKDHDIFHYLDNILDGNSDWKDFVKAAFYLLASKAKIM